MFSSIKKRYHWVIVLVLLAELSIYSGILNNLTSLHLIPVTEDLGISRGTFSLAISLRSLLGFFSTLVSSILITRFGYRRTASLALVVASGAFLLLGGSQNAFMLGLGAAILGMSEGFCSTSAASRLVNTWFHSHQGLVLGLVTASTGLGGSLFSVILSNIIEAYSWRSSYHLSVFLMACVAVLILLFSRNRPGDVGLRPFGVGSHHGKKPKKATRDHWGGYSAQEITKKPTFYLMILVTFGSCVCCYVAFNVVVPHFQDRGLSASEAAAVQSVMLLALAAAKFICGTLSDILGAKTVNMICLVCCAASLVMLAFASGLVMSMMAVVVFSIALVLTTITIPLLSSSLFGYHAQGAIVGIFMALAPASNVISSPVVNMIYDRIGSYSPIFLVAAALTAGIIVLTAILYILADRDRKRYEATHSSMPEMEETL